MTICEACAALDELKPNQYSLPQKIAWLSALDGMIFDELYATRGEAEANFNGYAPSADPDTELLVPFPYDREVYVCYLEAQIDRENGEESRYNQSITLYNNAYARYCAHLIRTRPPEDGSRRFLF